MAQVQAQMQAQMQAALRAQYDHLRPYLVATSQEPPTSSPPFDLAFVNLQIEHAPQLSPQTPQSGRGSNDPSSHASLAGANPPDQSPAPRH